VPVCFSGEMQNSRGALTPPAHPGSSKPCPARLALFHRRQPCKNESGQPYMLTIVVEERSMSNSWRRRRWAGTATLTLSVSRGGIDSALSSQRGAHELLDMLPALSIPHWQRRRSKVAIHSPFLVAQLGVQIPSS
jgi:hypothetical protein